MRPNAWNPLAVLAVLGVLSLAVACGGGTDTGDDGGQDGASGSPDAAAGDAAAPSDAASPDGGTVDVAALDTPSPADAGGDARPENCPADCPADLCQPVSGRCLRCGTNDDCLRGEWCREGACSRTLCVPGQSACEGVAVKLCGDDGMSYGEPVACPDGEACTAGECLPFVCTPGDNFCEDLQIRECNEVGTGWLEYPCQPGAVCRGDEGCVPYRNTILLIFDTSGSMDAAPFDIGGGACICPSGCPSIPYPACEKPLCPRSKLGLSKYAFTQLFSIIPTGNLHFVMTRFPQRVSRTQGACGDMFGTGHYQVTLDISNPQANSDWITGDDGSHAPADGSWFDQYAHEVVSVPFPTTEEEDTLALARVWMDFDEVMSPTGEVCTADDQCPAGFCDPDPDAPGQKVCFRHSNPELRATGNTPLGKSLFYAGEYIRKYVAVDGKACTADADCANVNYRCGPDGTCFDPLGHCRKVTVILFTDGVEEPATASSSFFNPRVQAKRMRYGLSCQIDADCGTDASCDAGICAGYPRVNGTGGSPPRPNDPEPSRLETYRGTPLEVTTHVIDLGEGEGTENNRLIADEGGGRYFSVHAGNPSELIQTLRNVTDIKQTLVCVPRFPAGYVPEE